MKRISLLVLAFASVFVTPSNRRASADDAPATGPSQPKLEYLYLEFTGLDATKAAAVEKAVAATAGVTSWTWTVATTEAKVVRAVGTAADATLLAAAKSAGAATAGVIPIAVTSLSFAAPLHCGGCVRTVNSALRALPAVKDVDVPAALTTVSIVYDTRTGTIEAFEKALADAGKPTSPRTAVPTR